MKREESVLEHTVLLVDDEENFLHGLTRTLRNQPYGIFTARSGEEAMRVLDTHKIDLVVADEQMPGMSGSDLLAWMVEHHPDVIRIMLTGHATVSTAIRAINEGAVFHFLTKPCNEIELADVLRKALEVRQANQVLRDSQANLQRLFDTRSDLLFVLDSDTRLVFFNPTVQERLGYSADELLGMPALEIHAPENREETARLLANVMDWKATTCTVSLLAKDGTRIPIETVITHSTWDNRNVLFGVARDVSERQRIEKGLREAKEAAEEANRAKSELLTMMSHRIKTPMTAILGFSDALLKAVDEPESAEAAKIIKRNGEYVIELINDILDLSKIEAGKMTLERITCSPWQVIDYVTSVMQIQSVKKGLILDVDYTFPLPETIHTDPIRLRQILLNLLGNAIKFTKQGAVRLAVRCRRDSDDSAKMEFVVTDTGAGMTAKETEQLFQPFTQAYISTSRWFGGTGLGLAISKCLAELLGGDIEAESTPGQGSTFTLAIDPGPLEDVLMLQSSPAASARSIGPTEPG